MWTYNNSIIKYFENSVAALDLIEDTKVSEHLGYALNIHIIETHQY